MHPRLILAAVGLAALAGAFLWWGQVRWQDGYNTHAAETAEATRELNERLRQATERAREAEADLSAMRVQLDRLEMEREDEAREDPDADRRGLSGGSLQRLDTIR